MSRRGIYAKRAERLFQRKQEGEKALAEHEAKEQATRARAKRARARSNEWQA
jgi:hypothetical protein